MIKQGENGDHFYIVNKGSYQAFLSQAGDKPVATYGEGDSFGELALLYTAPRAATVICKEAGSVWAIERKIFRYIMVQTGADQSKKIDGFLKSVSLLSVLTDQQRSTLANHIEEKRYVDSEYICEVRSSSAAPLFAPRRSCKRSQGLPTRSHALNPLPHVPQVGDIADAMFFVKIGEVAATVGADHKEVARYKPGEAFGESCLEPNADNAKRKANIVAVGNVALLKLSAGAFKEQLGSLTEVTAKNFKRKVSE